MGPRRPCSVAVACMLMFTSACDKVPLLAPGGTVISIFATSNTVPLNGEIEIVGDGHRERHDGDAADDADDADDPDDARTPRPRPDLDVVDGGGHAGAERYGHYLYDDARPD